LIPYYTGLPSFIAQLATRRKDQIESKLTKITRLANQKKYKSKILSPKDGSARPGPNFVVTAAKKLNKNLGLKIYDSCDVNLFYIKNLYG
jgi:hypothetical protein